MENNTDMQQYLDPQFIYGDVYSEDGDMTFIMRYDYDHLDGTMNTNVTGFYYGRPNEDDDRIYKETVVAKSEEE